jgi:hypothetical protein
VSAELEEERQFLLRSLADLERERAAGDLDDDDYAELRDGYTARAATVLRELDADRSDRVEPVDPPATPVPRRWARWVAVGAGLVAVAVAAGIGVAASSGQRLPGQSVSGDVAESVNTLLAEASALQNTDPRAAIDRYDAVLKVDPDNAEALTYRGWLVARVGSAGGAADLVDRGEELLDRAIAVAPGYADPYCFKAIIEFRYRGDAAAAKAPVDRCLDANPPQVVRGLVEGLQQEIGAVLAGTGTTEPPSTTLAP